MESTDERKEKMLEIRDEVMAALMGGKSQEEYFNEWRDRMASHGYWFHD